MASLKVGFLFLVGIAVSAAASHRIHISRKPSVAHAIRRMLLRAKSGVEPVVSRDGDMFYSGNITVGTPPQTFVTNFDTGTPVLWIMDASCKSEDCKDTPLFQKDQSSTFKSDNFSEMFGYRGKSYVLGVRAFETVTVSELSIKSQSFFLVNESIGNLDVKSIFGLGSLNESGTPSFYTAVDQKTVDKPILTVFLEKSKDNTFGGDITFGDYDTKNCGPVYAKTKSLFFDWLINTNSISINGKKVYYKEPLPSLVDTGTSFIILPFDIEKIIDEIQKKVELKQEQPGLYTLSCDDANKIPSLTINIDGYDHVIDGKQLAVPDGKRCDLGLVSGGFGMAILGDPFIRDRCVSQNIKTKDISFAHRK